MQTTTEVQSQIDDLHRKPGGGWPRSWSLWRGWERHRARRPRNEISRRFS